MWEAILMKKNLSIRNRAMGGDAMTWIDRPMWRVQTVPTQLVGLCPDARFNSSIIRNTPDPSVHSLTRECMPRVMRIECFVVVGVELCNPDGKLSDFRVYSVIVPHMSIGSICQEMPLVRHDLSNPKAVFTGLS
jgi:hypothetical protein